MRIAFPVFQNHGFDSLVHNHFDSAPLCVIVDTASRTLLEVANRSPRGHHDLCRRLLELGGGAEGAALVVEGIGSAMLRELQQAGIRVYQSCCVSLAGNLEQFNRQALVELTAAPACIDPYLDENGDLPSGFGCGF